MEKLYHHTVDVSERHITIEKGKRFVAGNVNVDTLTASFDEAWDGCEVRVIFSPKSGEPIEQHYQDGMLVPWEVLTDPGYLFVTFVGTRDGNVVIETAMQSKPFVIDKEGVVNGADPVPPTPSEYQQLMAEISRIRQDIEAGLIKGDDADIAGAEAAKDAANEAATRANAEADRAHGATLEAAAATQRADRAAREATVWADYAQDSANDADAAATNANEAASNANRTAAEIKQRADSGEFDGKDGKIPVKGVDYFDGEAGHTPVITASKSGNITTVYADGVQIAQIPDGAPGSDASATDVRINGSSIVVDGVADIPNAEPGDYKSAKSGLFTPTGIFETLSDGRHSIHNATYNEISNRNSSTYFRADRIDYAVKAAMTDGKGAAWSESEQLNARKRIGYPSLELIETITLDSPVYRIDRTETPDGTPYNFKRLIVACDDVLRGDGNATYYFIETKITNGSWLLAGLPTIDTTKRYSQAIADAFFGRYDARFAQNTSKGSNGMSWQAVALQVQNNIGPSIHGLRIVCGNSSSTFAAGMKVTIYGAWA